MLVGYALSYVWGSEQVSVAGDFPVARRDITVGTRQELLKHNDIPTISKKFNFVDIRTDSSDMIRLAVYSIQFNLGLQYFTKLIKCVPLT